MSSPFECIICYEFYNKESFIPTTLSCGHNCCLQHTKQITHCPICRTIITNNHKLVPNFDLRDGAVLHFELLQKLKNLNLDDLIGNEKSKCNINVNSTNKIRPVSNAQIGPKHSHFHIIEDFVYESRNLVQSNANLFNSPIQPIYLRNNQQLNPNDSSPNQVERRRPNFRPQPEIEQLILLSNDLQIRRDISIQQLNEMVNDNNRFGGYALTTDESVNLLSNLLEIPINKSQNLITLTLTNNEAIDLYYRNLQLEENSFNKKQRYYNLSLAEIKKLSTNQIHEICQMFGIPSDELPVNSQSCRDLLIERLYILRGF